MSSNKLLIISWTLFPWTSGSSVIVNNLAAQFSKDQLVLLGEQPKNRSTEGWPSDYPEIHYLDPNIRIAGRGARLLRWGNFLYCLKSASDLVKKDGVSAIMVIFPDDFYLYLAYRLSLKFNIPLYTWFHNTYLDNYTGWRRYLAKYLQPRVWKHAHKNWVMSDGMRGFYEQVYPEYRFSTLRHGFSLQVPDYTDVSLRKDKVSFVFTGSLNQSCEDASLRLMRHIMSNEQYELHVYTGNSISYFTQHGIAGERFHHHGFIQLSDLYAALRNYDIMLLPHGFDGARTDVEFQTIFPTRTIPLLLSNRPILAHSPPNTFLTEFLKERECALVVDTKSSFAIQKAIETLVHNDERREQLIKNALSTARLFNVREIAKQVSDTVGI